MKHRTAASVVPVLLALVAASGLPGQKSQADLQKAAKKKLQKPFVTAAPWMLDYDAARAAAKKQGKWLLTYFTRSYAP